MQRAGLLYASARRGTVSSCDDLLEWEGATETETATLIVAVAAIVTMLRAVDKRQQDGGKGVGLETVCS